MSLQRIMKNLALQIALGMALATSAMNVRADGFCFTCGSISSGCDSGGCGSQNGCCVKGCCPPALVHCTPKPPKLKFKSVCPKPVCDPCELEGYGFYPTCWRPWIPPLYCPNVPAPVAHLCPAVPQSGFIVAPYQHPAREAAQPNEQDPEDMLPPPQKTPR